MWLLSVAVQERSAYGGSSNAYMLVYIRDSARATAMPPLPVEAIPAALTDRFQGEVAAVRRRIQERLDEANFIEVQVYTDKDLETIPTGRDLLVIKSTAVVPHTAVRVLRTSTLGDFAVRLAETLHIPVNEQQIFPFELNKLVSRRAAQLFCPVEDAEKCIMDLALDKEGRCRLYLRQKKADEPAPPFNDILLFVKVYDAETEKLAFKGTLFVNADAALGQIMPQLAVHAGFPADLPLLVCEDKKAHYLEMLDPALTLRKQLVTQGSLLIVQPEAGATAEQGRCPTVIEFFSKLGRAVAVNFSPLVAGGRAEFQLPLDHTMLYSDVTKAVAEHLKVEADKLRFTSVDSFTKKPYDVIDWKLPKQTLAAMLSTTYDRWTSGMPACLFVEVLDMSLSELDNKLVLESVAVADQTTHAVTPLPPLLLELRTTVGGLAEAVRAQHAQQLPAAPALLRVVHVYKSRIVREVPLDEVLTPRLASVFLRVEAVPPEQEAEVLVRQLQLLLPAFSFARSAYYPFGNPFFVVLTPGEKIATFSARVQKQLGLPDKEWAKWKMHVYNPATFVTTLLADPDENFPDNINRSIHFGFDHADKDARRYASGGGAIKIHN